MKKKVEETVAKPVAGKNNPWKREQLLPTILKTGNETQIFFNWLNENFEEKPFTGIPRDLMYSVFSKHCKKIKKTIECREIFGKLVAQNFSCVNKRRLGGRDDMSYYYWGLDIKRTSSHYRRLVKHRIHSQRTRHVLKPAKKLGPRAKSLATPEYSAGSSKPKTQPAINIPSESSHQERNCSSGEIESSVPTTCVCKEQTEKCPPSSVVWESEQLGGKSSNIDELSNSKLSVVHNHIGSSDSGLQILGSLEFLPNATGGINTETVLMNQGSVPELSCDDQGKGVSKVNHSSEVLGTRRNRRRAATFDASSSAQRRKAANCTCGDCGQITKKKKSNVRRMCEILASPKMRTSLCFAIEKSLAEDKNRGNMVKKKFVLTKNAVTKSTDSSPPVTNNKLPISKNSNKLCSHTMYTQSLNSLQSENRNKLISLSASTDIKSADTQCFQHSDTLSSLHTKPKSSSESANDQLSHGKENHNSPSHLVSSERDNSCQPPVLPTIAQNSADSSFCSSNPIVTSDTSKRLLEAAKTKRTRHTYEDYDAIYYRMNCIDTIDIVPPTHIFSITEEDEPIRKSQNSDSTEPCEPSNKEFNPENKQDSELQKSNSDTAVCRVQQLDSDSSEKDYDKTGTDSNESNQKLEPPSGGFSVNPNVWRFLPAVLKERHKEKMKKWLSEEFEWSPPCCLPRQTVYDHYENFCQQNLSCTAPPAILGKMLQEQFKLLSMRRLGGRNSSKYYYMGLDIKLDSSAYEKLQSEKIITNPKPKLSRAFNGKKKKK